MSDRALSHATTEALTILILYQHTQRSNRDDVCVSTNRGCMGTPLNMFDILSCTNVQGLYLCKNVKQ